MGHGSTVVDHRTHNGEDQCSNALVVNFKALVVLFVRI